MSLISIQFFLFFFLVCVIYFLLPAKAQWVWLLIASLVFYYSHSFYSPHVYLWFLGIVLINWGGALFMDKPRAGKIVFRCVLIFDVLALCLFKYSEFIYSIILAIGKLFGADFTNYLCDLIVYYTKSYCPEKISYFALIIIAYITDVYWGKSKALKNPGKALLFTSYFPLMTSGPIVTIEQMEGQLFGEKHRFSYDRCVRGMERVLWGLFKKLVISERLAVIVTMIYEHYEVFNGFYIFVATAFFALQLYCDFSGLMDIVLGCSEVLGINLPENFQTPFYSVSLSEFWRRWHITLGAFLRDYVLYPLERSALLKKMRKFCKAHLGKGYEKKYNFPLYFSLLISWFLIGLWHGGGWNYIFGVGLYMWAVIVLGELLSPVFKWLVKVLHINTECASYTLFLRLRTFVLFMFGLSFFRANTLEDGFLMWKSAFARFNPWIFFDESFYNMGLDRREWGILLIGLLVLFVVSYLAQKRDVRAFLHEQNFVARLLLFAVLFAVIIVYGWYGADYNAADFIYGRF
ncbi:MAG: MBOAT family protein [Lachnospiraceae bacterium]|nr:MBOAT family protein [Lachnospiraceae bacterium]